MSLADLCQRLHREIGDLFTCEIQGDHLRLRTPYLYPDGDNIDLFFREQEGIVMVSDFGETTRWLRMQTASFKRSPKQRSLIDDICLTLNVEFYKGVLVARCRPDENFANVVTRVSQAALRVSDLWFTFRNRLVESLNDEVAEFFTEKKISFERGEKIPGRSGKIWTPDFHVRTPRRSSLVCVLSTGSRSAARSIVSQVYTSYSDLNHLIVGAEAIQFVSLFDDTSDVWSEEDFRLAEQISTVSRWSAPDQLLSYLEAA
jgi:hypothetical protein